MHGDWTFIVERISHLQDHVLLLKQDGNGEDDNLGAILWAGYMLAWYEHNRPEEWERAIAFTSCKPTPTPTGGVK